ncbi:MAG: hypothetical protein JNM70_09610 [Anaerolineae bacterium]|nr:hypothetical protein [Anaerolineae bacterium]
MGCQIEPRRSVDTIEALLNLQSIQFHLGTSLPIWLALWLAIKMIERETPMAEVRADGPLTAAVTMS